MPDTLPRSLQAALARFEALPGADREAIFAWLDEDTRARLRRHLSSGAHALPELEAPLIHALAAQGVSEWLVDRLQPASADAMTSRARSLLQDCGRALLSSIPPQLSADQTATRGTLSSFLTRKDSKR